MYFIQASQAYTVSKPLKPTLSLRQAGQLFSRPFSSHVILHTPKGRRNMYTRFSQSSFVSHHFHVYTLSKIHSFFVLTKFIRIVMYLPFFRIFSLLPNPLPQVLQQNFYQVTQFEQTCSMPQVLQQNFYQVTQFEQTCSKTFTKCLNLNKFFHSKNSSNFSRMLPNLSVSPKGYWNCYCDGN
jgi:hypothetical protein